MKSSQPFNLDDVIYAFENKLTCRHVSSEAAYRKELVTSTQGDAYAIGAVHLLTYPPELRQEDATFQAAKKRRTEMLEELRMEWGDRFRHESQGLSKANAKSLETELYRQYIQDAESRGLIDSAAIKAGGDEMVRLYKAEIRRMVFQSVDFDHRWSNATNCHFIMYHSMCPHEPYDLQFYPFGKCGKAPLNPTTICGGIFLDEHEKEDFKGNVDGIVNCLTEKILLQIQILRMRAQSRVAASASSSLPFQ